MAQLSLSFVRRQAAAALTVLAAAAALLPAPARAQAVSASTRLLVDPGLNRITPGAVLAGLALASDSASERNYAVSASASGGAGSISTFAVATTRASSDARTVFNVFGVANASAQDSFSVRASGSAADTVLLDFLVSATGDVTYAQSGNDTSSFGGLVKYSLGLGGGGQSVSLAGSLERRRQIDIDATRASGRLVMDDVVLTTGQGLNAGAPTLLTLRVLGGSATNFALTMSSEVIASVRGSSTVPGSFMTAAADFGHTLRWLGLARAYRPDGSAFEGELSFTSNSGFNYGQAVASVPEPSSWVLMGLGLLALLGLGRRAR